MALRIAHDELVAARVAFVAGAAFGCVGALADGIAKNLGRRRVAEGGILRWGMFVMWFLPFLSSILAYALVPSHVAARFGAGALGMFFLGLSLTGAHPDGSVDDMRRSTEGGVALSEVMHAVK